MVRPIQSRSEPTVDPEIASSRRMPGVCAVSADSAVPSMCRNVMRPAWHGRTGAGWFTAPVNTRAPASMRVLGGTVIGLVAGVLTGLLVGWMYAAPVGFDVAAGVFLAWTWVAVRRMDAHETAEHATQEDPTRRLTRLIVLAACVASLGGVGVLLVEAASAHGARRAGVAALGLISVAVSWFVVHGLFTLHYAELYYGGDGDPDRPGSGRAGGIDFGLDTPPTYGDFAYLAFTVGMTYQLSDTPLTTHALRASVLRHALLSYLFGALIIGASVNFVVSLAS